MTDTLYNDLKQKGLLLSHPNIINLPPIRPPKPTIKSSIASFFGSQFKLPQGPHNIIIQPVLNTMILVGRANTLILYKFDINHENVIIQSPIIHNLYYGIKSVHICEQRYLTDKGQIPILIQVENEIILFIINVKDNQLIQRNSLNLANPFTVKFLSDKQIMILSRNLQIRYYVIQGYKLVQKMIKLNLELSNLEQNSYLHHCRIVGNIDDQAISVITIFCLIKKPHVAGNQNGFQELRIKELVRTITGNIENLQQFIVLSNKHSNVLPQKFEIFYHDDFYCIETKHQILVIKKKFNKYMFIDSVVDNINDSQIKINPGAIITSYGKKTLQLSIIKFGDPKCATRILDTIQFQPKQQTFKLVWPIYHQNQTFLISIWQAQKKLLLTQILQVQPMKKMYEIVQKTKGPLSLVQQMAMNLGVNKKQFYLTLWQLSKRQINDIYQFLLPCGDIGSIKKQLMLTMKRRKILVTQFIKILQKMISMIKNELKSNLTQNMLKEYIKNDFLLRKIKLKEKDKGLDYAQLQKVYNSSLIDLFVQIVKNQLYPSQKMIDPLHAMVDQPQKQKIQLTRVFQQFRMVILQNYKKFIDDFLHHFQGEKILKVIKHYALLPKYPFQIKMIMHEQQYKTEVLLNQEMAKENSYQNQQLWFACTNSVEFNRQMSRERIQRQLHDYYPTSKIRDAIDTLINSTYGATQKLKKHSLISCTIEQYKSKLTDISDIKLFLKVCESVNEKDVYSQDNISSELVEIFRKNNNLVGKAYQSVKLYASIHRFMLKNNFCSKNQPMKIEQLMNLTKQDLIALFFLQNKQRKQFIFNEFRNLYIDLYKDPKQFNHVIHQFVVSPNCSRIQLQILIKQVGQKKQQFQQDNQELIQILIDGFCQKLQVRQDSDTQHFLSLISEIELKKQLMTKLNKIIQIRRCLAILHTFNCQKLTYYEMLKKDNHIFKIILQKYYNRNNQNFKQDFVLIQNQQIPLSQSHNMLAILIYLLETIYYDIEPKQMLITYGQKLIQYQEFDVLKQMIYEDEILQKLQIQPFLYAKQLVQLVLNTLYQDNVNIYNFQQKTIHHIKSIIDLLPSQNYMQLKQIDLNIIHDINIIRKKQQSKLYLADIFLKLSLKLDTNTVHIICNNWNSENEQKRNNIIMGVIQDTIDLITLQTLKQIYQCLQNKKQQNAEDVFYNTQFISYVIFFARFLLFKKRYRQILEALAFVKQITLYQQQSSQTQKQANYQLITQVVLQFLCQLYPNEQDLQKGKQLLQYFCQYYDDNERIQKLFKKQLKINFQQQQINKVIQIDRHLCFKNKQVKIDLKYLWNIAFNQALNRSNNKNNNNLSQMIQNGQIVVNKQRQQIKSRTYVQETYFCYNFLLWAFKKPQWGLRKLQSISYNLVTLTSTLQNIQKLVDENEQLWAVNCIHIYKSFSKGLIRVGVSRLQQKKQMIQSLFRQGKDINIQGVLTLLKQDKQRNKDILQSLIKIQQHTAAYNSAKQALKNNENKLLRFQQNVEKKQQKQDNILKTQPQNVQQQKNTAYMNLRVMRELKFQYTQLSNLSLQYISQKDMLQVIYNRALKQKQIKNNKNKPMANTLFLADLTNSQQSVQKQIINKLEQGSYNQIIQKYSVQNIKNTLKTLYQQKIKDFSQIINVIDALKLGQKRKIQFGILAKIYRSNWQGDLRDIFPFQFFFTGEGLRDSQLVNLAYSEVSSNVQTLIQNKNEEIIRKLASFIGHCFNKNIFEQKVYLDCMMKIINSGKFNSESIVRLRTMMQMISADVLYQNLNEVINAADSSQDMKIYVKKQLQIWAKQHYPGDLKLKERIQGQQ